MPTRRAPWPFWVPDAKKQLFADRDALGQTITLNGLPDARPSA
ncbi:MAG: hypothetical protein U5J83_02780 [Bryobacterales bacterium]|nr:hypothetical protein [Bryobacterales bacterium]